MLNGHNMPTVEYTNNRLFSG